MSRYLEAVSRGPRGSESVDKQVADRKRCDLTLEKHRAQRVLRASFFLMVRIMPALHEMFQA